MRRGSLRVLQNHRKKSERNTGYQDVQFIVHGVDIVSEVDAANGRIQVELLLAKTGESRFCHLIIAISVARGIRSKIKRVQKKLGAALSWLCLIRVQKECMLGYYLPKELTLTLLTLPLLISLVL